MVDDHAFGPLAYETTEGWNGRALRTPLPFVSSAGRYEVARHHSIRRSASASYKHSQIARRLAMVEPTATWHWKFDIGSIVIESAGTAADGLEPTTELGDVGRDARRDQALH